MKEFETYAQTDIANIDGLDRKFDVNTGFGVDDHILVFRIGRFLK
jgi:hypothetical protein